MTCAKCKRELGEGDKVHYDFIGLPFDPMNPYCESCWKELMKLQPVNPNWTDAPPHIPEKLT